MIQVLADTKASLLFVATSFQYFLIVALAYCSETVEQLYCTCTPDIIAGIHAQLTFVSIFNAFLLITAFLGDALLLVAVHN